MDSVREPTFAFRPATPAPPVKPRLTVVRSVYHQLPGEEPTAVQNRFMRTLEREEPTQKRRYTVGAEWLSLNAGSVAMAVVANEEGAGRQTRPTEEEAADLAAKVVEVGVGGVALALVRPGENLEFEPAGGAIMLRCRSGSARVVVTLIPG